MRNLRRYLAAAIFTAFIACAIGIYYVQASFERLPQFRLITTSGDAKEGEPLVVEGGYIIGAYIDRLKVTSSGSRYESERSWGSRILDKSNGYRYDPTIDRLIKQFPDFMRSNRSADYQDDEVVIRAGLIPHLAVDNRNINYLVQFDILDKATKQTRTLKSSLPDTNTSLDGNIIHAQRMKDRTLLDVQRMGDVLKIAVNSVQLNEEGRQVSSGIRIYDIDWTSGQVIGRSDLVYGISAGEGQELSVFGVTEYAGMQANPQLVLEVNVMELNGSDTSMNAADNANAAPAAQAVRQLTPVHRQLTIYDYASGKSNAIPLALDPPDHDQANQTRVYRMDHFVLLVSTDETAVKVSSYQLDDGKRMFENSWTKEELQVDAGINSGVVGTKRLYLKFESGGASNIVLVDPATGDFTYRGAVTLDGVEEGMKDTMLMRLNMGPISFED